MSRSRFDIITIFPRIFDSYFNESIIKRARAKKLVDIRIHNIRDFTKDKHRKVDDKPYGGGAGMVLMAEPILKAVQKISARGGSAFGGKNQKSKIKIVVLSAKGRQFNQKMAYDWSKKYKNYVFISGRYEGIDERVRAILKAEEVSIGPYVITDGDVAAMVIVSVLTRLIPGVINWESLQEESHFSVLIKREKKSKDVGTLEYPHYTRPEILKYKGKKYAVPKVLLSGDHKKIEEWRKSQRK